MNLTGLELIGVISGDLEKLKAVWGHLSPELSSQMAWFGLIPPQLAQNDFDLA